MAIPYFTEGYPTLITTNGIFFFEKTVETPGITGGGPIDITTMRAVLVRLQSPKTLASIMAATSKCAYDPRFVLAAYNVLLTIGQIAYTWPEGSTYVFWGWIEEFKPEALEEGKFPLADVKFEATNSDLNWNIAPPVITPAP